MVPIKEDQGCAKYTIIHWTHHVSNLLMLCFAAISPFVYVFRSTKVQSCVGQVLQDTFCFTTDTTTNSYWPHQSRTKSNSFKIKRFSNDHPSMSSEVTANTGVKNKLERNKSSSCPNINEATAEMEPEVKPEVGVSDTHQTNQKIIENNTQNILNTIVMKKHSPVMTTQRKNPFYLRTAEVTCDHKGWVTGSTERFRKSGIVATPPPHIVYTSSSSNMDVYNTVIYEEDDEGLMPPDNDILNHRRLSTSLPYGLDLIGGIGMETTLESTV